jgi:hypothetical protein
VNKKVYTKKYSWVMPSYMSPFDRKYYETVPGEEWTCTDVTMINDREKLFPRVALVLKNNEGRTTAVVGNQQADSFLNIAQVWTSSEYEAYKLVETKRLDSIRAARKTALLKKEKQHPGYKQSIIKKYGSIYGDAVANGEVSKGMTPDMCRASWGSPKSVIKGTLNRTQLEQWIYNDHRWVRFINGHVDIFVE